MQPHASGLGPCARWLAVGESLGARVAAHLVASGAVSGAALLCFPLLPPKSSQSQASRLPQLLAAAARAPPVPLLLVHGELDAQAPAQQWAAALAALASAGAAPQLHDVPRAGHSLVPKGTQEVKTAARASLLAAVAAFIADAAAQQPGAAAAEQQPAKRQRQ